MCLCISGKPLSEHHMLPARKKKKKRFALISKRGREAEGVGATATREPEQTSALLCHRTSRKIISDFKVRTETRSPLPCSYCGL